MKVSFIDICGFRGYRDRVRIDLSPSFTVIDGRNGVGKSTVFDAVEFVLTGTISKYLDATADRESVDDYLWWTGGATAPMSERYVRVGFIDNDQIYVLERTPATTSPENIVDVTSRLFDRELAPKGALTQLCATSIIRDEHITRLSLDLKETDRFALLRDAIGAVDADEWIRRSASLANAASARVRDAENEVEQVRVAFAAAARQLDQVRAALRPSSLVSEASRRLQSILKTTAVADELNNAARRALSDLAARTEVVRDLVSRITAVAALRDNVASLKNAFEEKNLSWTEANGSYEAHVASLSDTPVATVYSDGAKQLENLVALGRAIGLRRGHCPLCESSISPSDFENGLRAAISAARQLDAQAVDQASRERARDEARTALERALSARNRARLDLRAAETTISEFEDRVKMAGLQNATLESLTAEAGALENQRALIANDLRLFDTASFDQTLSRTTGEQNNAKERLERTEARLGRARLSETRAKAIHDAVRRASHETLDQRLERVLPLMSELYRRLRPHPVWDDIEYSVRGDVRRFLKLQVGGDVNPQFVFSSGQRRATGLAFLLSVNLSIAWSRWQSVLLDDPVQHVDDFRTVHLAEVLAHICAGGRQVICAVEDSALADLMCRRLPSNKESPGKRITLAYGADGAIAICRDQEILPLARRCLVQPEQPLSA